MIDNLICIHVCSTTFCKYPCIINLNLSFWIFLYLCFTLDNNKSIINFDIFYCTVRNKSVFINDFLLTVVDPVYLVDCMAISKCNDELLLKIITVNIKFFHVWLLEFTNYLNVMIFCDSNSIKTNI